jgi:hypothetical protein
MNAEHINFMLALRGAIDKETAALGAANPKVQQLWAKFNTLWKRDLPANTTNNTTNNITNNTQNPAQLQRIQQDINLIKERLLLHCAPSVDFSFVQHEATRQQLQFDNLRMENNVYQIDKHSQKYIDYLHEYASLAFVQVEELMNYYYTMRFPNINDFKHYLTQRTSYKMAPQAYIGAISMYLKSFAYCTEFYAYDPEAEEKDFTSYTIQTLRFVRNETAHRCTILKLPNQDESLLTANEKRVRNYLKFNSIHQTREAFQRFVAKLAEHCQQLPK